MNGRDFYTAVHAHADLEWLGVREADKPEDDEAFIRNSKRDATYAVKIVAIRDTDLDELFDVLVDGRSPMIMEKVTRIVGYYSMLQNWNKSKIAELKDRHKGDYAIHNEAPDLKTTYTAGVARAS